MAMGHGCMACERWVLCGLLLLVLGNGLFKPTVSSLLSRLYDPPSLAGLRDRVRAFFSTGFSPLQRGNGEGEYESEGERGCR